MMLLNDRLKEVTEALEEAIWGTCITFAKDFRWRGWKDIEDKDLRQIFHIGIAEQLKRDINSSLALCWTAGLCDVINEREKYLANKRDLNEETKVDANLCMPKQWGPGDPLDGMIAKDQALCTHTWSKLEEKHYICERCGLESTYKRY